MNKSLFPYLSNHDMNTIARLFTLADKDKDGFVSTRDLRRAATLSKSRPESQDHIMYFPESSVNDIRLSLLDLLKYNNAQRECGWID